MPPSSLYRIGLQKICDLLKEGKWSSQLWLFRSPFSDLPSEIVDDLMKCLQCKNIRVADVFLLLTSGKLTRLDLTPFDYVVFNAVMHLQGCNSLRFLTLYSYQMIYKPLIQTFICNCRNLEVVHVEGMDSEMVVSALEYCPKLSSLGSADSLDALEAVQRNFTYKFWLPAFKLCCQLQLRKCVWRGRAVRVGGFQYPFDIFGETSTRSKFLKKLRIAVSLCPLVEDLEIDVKSNDSFEELKKLKRLTVLSIHMNNCEGGFLPSFIELLRKIGPQLKHLTIKCFLDCHFPVDLICSCCPNLQTLQILGRTTASNSADARWSLRLKKLLIAFADQNALLFLLSNCECLEELELWTLECFDSSFFDRIMKTNPVSDLKCVSVKDLNATRIYILEGSKKESVFVGDILLFLTRLFALKDISSG